MAFQNRLKERREFLNLSRADLAKKLNITVSAIGNYENGVSSPKTDVLYDIFKVLDCDANYLFQDEMNSSDTLSLEATEIAQAYDKAELKTQNIVRMTLDLPLKEEKKVVELKPKEEKEKIKEHLIVNAAHAIEGASEEDIKHDDDIMDDPDF